MNGSALLDRGNTVLGVLLALGLIIGGWVLGSEIKATRLGMRAPPRTVLPRTLAAK